MDKKYTIKDIAKLSGVSKGTVDRVLHKRGRVSENALQKVTKVLQEIKYEPNLIARNLKSKKIHKIGVLMPDPKIDAYWQPCVEGIEDAIKEMKTFKVSIELVYFNPKSVSSFLESNETIITANPDAVLLVPLFYKETLSIVDKYKEQQIMVSTFNNQLTSEAVACFVGQNLFQSGRVAAKLISSVVPEGNLAIIHVDEVYKNAIHMQEKAKGFKSFFKEIENSSYTLHTCKIQQKDFKNSLLKFFSKHPDIRGLFITTSKAFKIAEFVISQRKSPKPVIVGYDLLKENIEYLQNNTIDFLIHQNQKQQANLAIMSMLDYFIFEKKINKEILLPIQIINSENYHSYLDSVNA